MLSLFPILFLLVSVNAASFYIVFTFIPAFNIFLVSQLCYDVSLECIELYKKNDPTKCGIYPSYATTTSEARTVECEKRCKDPDDSCCAYEMTDLYVN